ncbi:hypothetical protein MRX96_015811 [Rhipicephalus microplus]
MCPCETADFSWQNENVSRETCMRLYRKKLQFQQGTRPPKNSQMQGRSLTKAIAKNAQLLHRPMLPSLAAYEHQEWQAVANGMDDLPQHSCDIGAYVMFPA